MKLRQAKKIMKNVRLHPLMHWTYGSGRVGKANRIRIHHYGRVNPSIKEWNAFAEKNPLLAIKVLNRIMHIKNS